MAMINLSKDEVRVLVVACKQVEYAFDYDLDDGYFNDYGAGDISPDEVRDLIETVGNKLRMLLEHINA